MARRRHTQGAKNDADTDKPATVKHMISVENIEIHLPFLVNQQDSGEDNERSSVTSWNMGQLGAGRITTLESKGSDKVPRLLFGPRISIWRQCDITLRQGLR